MTPPLATDAAPARPAGYSPQVDGLRALSVAAVAYSHWLPAWQFGVPLGAGVHLFFVLSGFLITRILLTLRDAPRRGQAVRRFYVRRSLRLFPAFYLVLGLAWLADVPRVRETWAWHAAYLSNLRVASDARWMGHVSHFWSLAVEEQFYLLWPWLVVWSPRAWLGPLLALAVLSGPASRYMAASVGLAEPFWALVPAGSADSLGVGALVAWAAWRRGAVAPGAGARWPARGVLAVAATAWVVLAISDAGELPLAPAWAVWRQLLQGVVFAWVVWRAVAGFAGPVGGLLAHPWTVAVGRISYGVYLIHAFAPVVVHAAVRLLHAEPLMPAAPVARAAIYAATTLGLATFMWHLVERPLLALKTRVPYAR